MQSFHRQSGIALTTVIAILAFASISVALMIPAYQSLKVRALQSEAQVILSYIGTLEAAYFVDKGSYLYFDQFYGSPFMGRDNCARPEGAVELGLLLRNCQKDPRAGGLRYAFRVLPPDPLSKNFIAEANSGSDIAQNSYICLGAATAVDKWHMSADKKIVNTAFCD